MAEGHNFRQSGYERRAFEKYYTQHWCTRALLHVAPMERLRSRVVWEPAAGRGDIAEVLQDAGIDTTCTDLTGEDFNHELGSLQVGDFFATKLDMVVADECSGIITNPPYGGDRKLYDGRKMPIAEAFVRHSLTLGIDYVAMFMRTDFNHSNKRKELFKPGFGFAYEVVMTSRPRWDWWYEKDPWEPDKGPMHNFSWFVWDQQWQGPSTQFWVGPDDLEEPEAIEEDGDEE